MDIWSAGCIFYELIVGRPPFVHGGIITDSGMLESISDCFVPVTMHGSSDHQSSASQRPEALQLRNRWDELFDESAKLNEQFLASFRSSLSYLREDTAHEILTGCLCPNQEGRSSLDSLAAAGARLLAEIPQEHLQLDDV